MFLMGENCVHASGCACTLTHSSFANNNIPDHFLHHPPCDQHHTRVCLLNPGCSVALCGWQQNGDACGQSRSSKRHSIQLRGKAVTVYKERMGGLQSTPILQASQVAHEALGLPPPR